MVGDGLTWSLQITLDMSSYVRAPTIWRLVVPEPILQLFWRLPTVAGVGIRRDVLLLKRFFSLLNPLDTVEMPPWLDVGTLAIAAGWALRARGMSVLGVQVTGTMMNKLISTGDDCWGARWDKFTD